MFLKRWLIGFVTITAMNWLTQLGSVLVTVSAFSILALIAFEMVAEPQSAYLGIVTFMILPGVFMAGLLLIPIGAWWARRHPGAGDAGSNAGAWPVFDLNHPRTRSVARTIIFLTVVNVILISFVSYRAVVYTESVQFCGQVCHTVMEPEFTAYQNSPHSRVACVECHIGPGAPWFVKSKLSGLRQVLAVARNSYSTPIPSPVRELRPSKETCEECHWPARFSGDRMRIIKKYTDDEANTPVYSVLLMHIGGGHGSGHGIHSWHIDPTKSTEYLATDERRQEIAVVRVTGENGERLEFRASDLKLTDAEIAGGEFRTMDCVDCHNRPTHIFYKPEKAIDLEMANGAIDASLPYIKREAVAALTGTEGGAGDRDAIAKHIRDFYAAEYPDIAATKQAELDAAIAALQKIYGRNVFPEMKVTWGTYPNNLGHEDFPGCFRCHDDSHATADGKSISGDCELCHTVLAWDEEEPAVLKELQLQQ